MLNNRSCYSHPQTAALRLLTIQGYWEEPQKGPTVVYIRLEAVLYPELRSLVFATE